MFSATILSGWGWEGGFGGVHVRVGEKFLTGKGRNNNYNRTAQTRLLICVGLGARETKIASWRRRFSSWGRGAGMVNGRDLCFCRSIHTIHYAVNLRLSLETKLSAAWLLLYAGYINMQSNSKAVTTYFIHKKVPASNERGQTGKPEFFGPPIVVWVPNTTQLTSVSGKHPKGGHPRTSGRRGSGRRGSGGVVYSRPLNKTLPPAMEKGGQNAWFRVHVCEWPRAHRSAGTQRTQQRVRRMDDGASTH